MHFGLLLCSFAQNFLPLRSHRGSMSPDMNKNRFQLLSLILIALALRLTFLGEQSLWYDEGVTWMLSQMQLPDLIGWTAADIQPPLYYLLIWFTDIIFSDSEWALRFPSVIFGILNIPLIYVLARRLFPTPLLSRTPAPLLAAALFTISPLMIYYSQEARMYTLLTFEATLAGYLLLKILYPSILNPQPPITNYKLLITNLKSPLLYALTAAIALYTHYFAAFLLIAHAAFALYILWRQRFGKTLLIQLLISFGGALFLFAPWLTTLLARLGDDPSYWPGALKLDEVLRKVAITFTAGETVFEQVGSWLALIYFGFLILGFGFLWAKGKFKSDAGYQNSIIFLALWLLLPILLILALTYQSPKFNPRYTMLAWPALALLTAAVIAELLHKPQSSQATSNAPSAVSDETRLTSRLGQVFASRIFTIIFTLFILGTAIFSLTNWFTDPRFAKDDFKALAQFVQERKAADETVLLSSGHLFPVWAYYYGWEGWTPLPWMLRLDVNQVTDLSISADIAAAVKDQAGVWLVTWQDEVIDPNGVVSFWLDMVGQRPVDAGDFWGVGLEHWRLDANKIEQLSKNPIKRPAAYTKADKNSEGVLPTDSYNFANQVDLVGMTQLNDTDMVLFWRPRQPLPDHLVMTLSLTDKEGFTWSRETITGRPGAYFYPPSRWPVGEIVMTHHQPPWQIGTPPGLYVAEIGLGVSGSEHDSLSVANAAAADYTGWDILDQQGRPQRRTALIDFVNLSQLVRPEVEGALPIAKNPLVDFLPIIGLRRSILPEKTARPGDRILLALLWQAGEFNLDDVSVAFDMIDAAGQTHRVGASYTPSRQFDLPRWKPGDMVLGQYWLDIPPEAVPGPATLQLHLINSTGWTYDEVFSLDEIEILPTERNFSPPDAVDIPLEADFSGQATLIGLDCPENCRATSGDTINLTLYWRAETPTKVNYTVFTHLLDSEETVLINADHAPPKSTQGWVPGEIIVDQVTLPIPPDLPSNRYTVEIGLYNAADPAFERLPLATGQTRVILSQALTID